MKSLAKRSFDRRDNRHNLSLCPRPDAESMSARTSAFRGQSRLIVLTLSSSAFDPEQKSNAADKAFPLVPIDRTPPRHAVRVPVPQGTVVSQISGNDQRRNRPFSGDRIIRVVVGCALLRANVGRSCR